DRDALFVKLSDEAIYIGTSPAPESYLCGDKIIEAAKRVGADAIHPGYGFLSENADFAKSVERSGLIFIGPSAGAIRLVGEKTAAKNLLAKELPSVPLVPGYNGANQDVETLIVEAKKIGFPVLLKASAGGGGRGMRVVHDEFKMREEIALAKSEALHAFGSDILLIEKYFESIRHVEIQLMGDKYGNVYHLFERDCSVQRRHQKVIEETPCPVLTQKVRERMTKAAIDIGKLLKYEGAGTIEFLLDEKDRFYFLEMNTRLQVEHPITELITGLDLVDLQIRVAQGYDLSQSKLPTLRIKGHAIECRLYSEDPANNFSPAVGRICYWQQADTPNVRYDTGIETGSEVEVYYDPLISKISVFGATRGEALHNMTLALQNTIVLGLVTNQLFLSSIVSSKQFASGFYNTNLIDELFSQNAIKNEALVPDDLSVIPFLWLWYLRERQRTTLRHIPSGWRYVNYKNPADKYKVNGREVEIDYKYEGKLDVKGNKDYKFSVELSSGDRSEKIRQPVILHDATVQGDRGIQRIYYIANGDQGEKSEHVYMHSKDFSSQIKFTRISRMISLSKQEEDDLSPYTAPMPCKILRLLVKSGSRVKKNDPLLTIESMKIEVRLYSRHDGIVNILVKEGDVVNAGTLLVKISH
ncbi:4584_t:CDS:10, partial [Paraglomus brasilianum]